MTRKEINEWIKLTENGTIKEDLNPAFIFSLTATKLLSKIAKGDFNLQELAKRELENRGQNIDGIWVGFNKEIE